MVTDGKLIQVNHWLNNKKVIALLLPLRFPAHKQTVNILKKALNKGLHDVSVHTQIPLLQRYFFVTHLIWGIISRYRRLNIIDFYMSHPKSTWTTWAWNCLMKKTSLDLAKKYGNINLWIKHLHPGISVWAESYLWFVCASVLMSTHST